MGDLVGFCILKTQKNKTVGEIKIWFSKKPDF